MEKRRTKTPLNDYNIHRPFVASLFKNTKQLPSSVSALNEWWLYVRNSIRDVAVTSLFESKPKIFFFTKRLFSMWIVFNTTFQYMSKFSFQCGFQVFLIISLLRVDGVPSIIISAYMSGLALNIPLLGVKRAAFTFLQQNKAHV